MRRLLSLRGLAIAVWVSCLGFIGLPGVMLTTYAWHPHFLPAASLLALVIAAGLGLVGGASWRIVRGPDRRGALCWLLLGSAPLWFLAGFLLYGLAVGSTRKLPMNDSIKLLAPLAESLMDLEARFRYPQRTVGEEVVMISAPMPVDAARAQVAAMDRHVRALEARLGRANTRTIHWVRGPLLGRQGVALLGICLGSRPGEAAADAEGLAALDRHEVAHCVLAAQSSPWFAAPAVLIEGWAEASQGSDPVEQASRALERLNLGRDPTLRQLVGDDWYDRHERPVYLQGAPLVTFLLDRFGPERFLRLYSTCTRSTFEADCRRILDLDLDGLDAAYRADLERRTERGGILGSRLRRLATGPKVAGPDWQAFLDDYLPEAERLIRSAPNARVSFEFHHDSIGPDGKTTRSVERIDSIRSGELRSVRTRSKDVKWVCLAHPRRSFEASWYRQDVGAAWEVRESPGLSPEHAYRRALAEIDLRDPWVFRGGAAGLLGIAVESWARADLSTVVVTDLERFTEGGRHLVRVRLEDRRPAGWRSITMVLDADDHFAVQSDETEMANATRHSATYTYDRHAGLPILRSAEYASTADDRSRTTGSFATLDRRFEAIPEAEFTREHLLAGAPSRTITDPDPFAEQPSMLARWYWLPFAVGALGLLLGSILSLRFRSRRGVPSKL